MQQVFLSAKSAELLIIRRIFGFEVPAAIHHWSISRGASYLEDGLRNSLHLAIGTVHRVLASTFRCQVGVAVSLKSEEMSFRIPSHCLINRRIALDDPD
jgi:hypothetical protein